MTKYFAALITGLFFVAACSTVKPVVSVPPVVAPEPPPKTDTVVHFEAIQSLATTTDYLMAAQVSSNDKTHYGTWLTTGSLTQAKINSFPLNILQGVRFRVGPIDINKKNGIYDFTGFDEATRLAVTNRLSIGFQLWRNPYEQDPFFWGDTLFKVPIVFTNDSKVNKYYYYLDNNFLYLIDALTVQLAQHISLLSADQKKALAFWLGSFGKTGDYDAYAGTPTDRKYIIQDTTWTAYVLASANKLIAVNKQYNNWLNVAMNPANTGNMQDIYLALDVLYFKGGDFGHGYSGNGSGEFARRIQKLLSINPNTCFFSESEGIQQDSSWHPQNWMAIVGESVTAGVKILSIAAVDNTSAVGCAVLNKYAGERFGKRFWMARDVIDYADSTRFKEANYGAVIDPLRLKRYQQQVANVLADTTMGQTAKDDKLSSLLATYINQKRVDTLQKEWRKKGYDFNPNSQYYNDGGIDLIRGDYGNNGLRLVNEDAVSIGVQRVGGNSSSTAIGSMADAVTSTLPSPTFGRYARRPKPNASWYFDSDFETTSDSMTISITYLDAAGRWQMNLLYWDGKSPRIRSLIRSTQTNDWMTVSFTVPASKGKLSGHTFALQFINSPIVAMVEQE